ncbi:hypothetical protein PRIPAC_92600 [Pristionchus pacificus]|uniref:Uncharacterized protein n=1 Tax=Pristionchus pacificus TaxID=54126 RepID=A0A454XKI6_PRIPA|nr:hypothetical protein PRIPAC_92600 [Pristionchus pacificus]|eukprot:PDM63059.1 hypothetical protein PRIPAC_50274 [Pristionchus pacificus]
MCGCFGRIANIWNRKRNGISSIVAGALFFSAWWIVLDTAIVADKKDWTNDYFILTVASTVSMVMLNAVSLTSQIRARNLEEPQSVLGVKGTALWLLIASILSVLCVFASYWLLIAGYIFIVGEHVLWPGVTLISHNLMIALSSLFCKFGRIEDLTVIENSDLMEIQD